MTGLERLRNITDGLDRGPWLGDVTRALYDTARQIERDQADDHEISEWVRKNGGVERIENDLSEYMQIARSVTMELFKDSFPTRIANNDEITEELDKRLMPPGMEWPRYEDGKPVMIGDEFSEDPTKSVDKIEFAKCGFYLKTEMHDFYWYRNGERVRRPKQDPVGADGLHVHDDETVYIVDGNGEPLYVIDTKADGYQTVVVRNPSGHVNNYDAQRLTHQLPVLDAEGNRIEPAMDVWWVCDGDERGVHAEKLHVESIGDDGLVTCDPFNGGTWVELEPSEMYVHKPVLCADGKPLKVGDTVWDINGGEHELVITSIELDELEHVKATQEKPVPANVSIHPSRLTHTKPEPLDSWEQLEDDATMPPEAYCVAHDLYNQMNNLDDFPAAEVFARDLVSRAKALAERERGE